MRGLTIPYLYSFVLFHRIQLQDPDEDDDENLCSIVVSLMRIDRKRTPANERPPIGFAIYKVTIKLPPVLCKTNIFCIFFRGL